MKLRISKILFYITLLIFSFFPFCFDGESIISFLIYNYGFQLIFILVFLKLEFNSFNSLLSPSLLALFYINLNFFIGNWAYQNEFITHEDWVSVYLKINNLSLISFYFNLSNIILFLSYDFAKKIRIRRSKNVDKTIFSNNKIFAVIITVLLLIFLSRLTINLNLLGGEGDFSIIFKSILALILITLVSKIKNFSRIILYLIILVFFVSFSFGSKREAIFLLFPILLLEFNSKSFRYNFKLIFFSSVIIGLTGYFIILMSITRGYGDYKVNNVFESANYVESYIKSDLFLPYLMNNLEVSSTNINSVKSVDYIIEESDLLTYGSTFIKFIFIPIPRKYFPEKPRSMIDIYTNKFAPDFRDEGGSYPISIQSEAFWNFHFGGLLFIFLFFIVSNFLYRKLLESLNNYHILNKIYLLYAYTIFLYLVRGSGFDIFFIYLIIGTVFYFLYKLLFTTFIQTLRRI